MLPWIIPFNHKSPGGHSPPTFKILLLQHPDQIRFPRTPCPNSPDKNLFQSPHLCMNLRGSELRKIDAFIHWSVYICYIYGGFSKNGRDISRSICPSETLPLPMERLNICPLPWIWAAIGLLPYLLERGSDTTQPLTPCKWREYSPGLSLSPEVSLWERTRCEEAQPHKDAPCKCPHHWQPTANVKHTRHVNEWACSHWATPHPRIPPEASDALEQRQLSPLCLAYMADYRIFTPNDRHGNKK